MPCTRPAPGVAVLVLTCDDCSPPGVPWLPGMGSSVSGSCWMKDIMPHATCWGYSCWILATCNRIPAYLVIPGEAWQASLSVERLQPQLQGSI